MSVYDDEVLADNPVRYWKGEELPGATSATDLSGNNGHAPIFVDEAELGIPGPIQTDATSLGVKGRFAEAASPSGSDTDLRDNFTLEMWGKVDELINDHGLLTRLGQWGLAGSFAVGFNSGSVFARISGSGGGSESHDLSYGPILPATYYYIAVVRNDTVISLQVNSLEFADIDSTFPTGPIVNTTYNSAPWVLGSLRTTFTSGYTSPSDGGARWALYDTALTYARRLAHYEAALNILGLNGYSNVVSSAVLYSDVEPDPVSFPFRHNWTDDWIERFSFATGISTARKGYEQANAQRVEPRREIEITQVLKDDYERRMFRAKLNANQHRKWFFPMLDHRDRLTGTIASGVSVFTIDTLYKDYEVGGYFGLRQLNDAGRITHWEELLITGLTDTQITTATQTANSYTNAEAYPVRRAIIQQSQSLRGHTDSVEEMTITARLIAEDEKSIPHRIVEFAPATTYKSHEVFPVDEWPNNWAELRDYEATRMHEEVDFTAGPFVIESDAIAASETLSWRIILQTLQQQAEFLGWFYAHAGSLTYLWVPTMQRDFEAVGSAGDDLTVAGHNYFDNYAASEFRRDIAFVYNDNSMVLRRIQAVTLDGANEVLDLDTVVPTLTNLRSVSYLLFCRLDNDTLERAAATDTKARFSWLFREILSSPV